MTKPKYIVEQNGEKLVFVLKKTSKNARQALADVLENWQKKVVEASKILEENLEITKCLDDPDYSGELTEDDYLENPEIDEIDVLLESFKAITIGDHDKIDPDEFDAKLAEQARDDFLLSRKGMISDMLKY